MRNEHSNATVKKTTTSTKRAVSYLKETWRRVVKTPRKPVYNFGTSKPPPTRRAPVSCINRTQLDDVVDDDELTTITSNDSHGVLSTCTSELSPIIEDSDWRHFMDTAIVSSPSTFLGSWSSSPTSPGRESKNEVCSSKTSTFSIIDSTYFAGNADDFDVADFYNSPTRPSSATGFRAPFSSSQISIDTPTPAVRARPASDPAMSSTTVADLEKLLNNVHMDDTPPPVPTFQPFPTLQSLMALAPPPESSAVDDAETEDKWSFVSVCGGSTTNDLLNYQAPDLPASKRRKISVMEIPDSASSTAEKESFRPRDHPRFSNSFVGHHGVMANKIRGTSMFWRPPPPHSHVED
jgi:hypothetical protein